MEPSEQLPSSLPSHTVLSDNSRSMVVLPPVVAATQIADYRFLAGKIMGKERAFRIENVGRNMQCIFSPKQGMFTTGLGGNIFLFRFTCGEDLQQVHRRQPWRYGGHLLVLAPVSGNLQTIDNSVFNQMVFWIQIHGLPLSHITAEIGRVIGETLGVLIAVDAGDDQVFRFGFILVRVGLSTQVALQRKTTVLLGDKMTKLKLRYERLPEFCTWCGFLDHEEEDCVWEKALDKTGAPNRRYKEWIRAEVINFSVAQIGMGSAVPMTVSTEVAVVVKEIQVDTEEGHSVKGKEKVIADGLGRDESYTGSALGRLGVASGQPNTGPSSQLSPITRNIPNRSVISSPSGQAGGIGSSQRKKVRFVMRSHSSGRLPNQTG